MQPQILFVCEHGAAKSIIAAAYFNQLAEARNLSVRAFARGTDPDDALSENAVYGLAQDGLTPTESMPKKLLEEEAASAERIVTFCDLPPGLRTDAAIEKWDGVPAVSDDYMTARDAILQKLDTFMERFDE